MRTFISVLGIACLLTVPRAGAAQGARYKVIVNSANSATVLQASELSKIFLRTATIWPSGTPVLPVDLTDASAVRQQFVREIIRKDSVALSRYWEQAIFAGRAVPPPTMASEQEIVAFVRRYAGAIGYVSASTTTGPDVRVVVIAR